MINKNKYEEYTLLLGTGFALNVYLPALTVINCKLIALEKSSQKLTSSIFSPKINFKWSKG